MPPRYVGVYIVHNGRLLVHRRSEALDGFLISPGGSVDPGERPTAAAVRETLEESGVDVDEAELVNFYTSDDGMFAGYVTYRPAFPEVRGPLPEFRDEIDMDYDFSDFPPEEATVLRGTGHAFVDLRALLGLVQVHGSQRYFTAAVAILANTTYNTTFRDQLVFISNLSEPYVRSIQDYTSSDFYESLNRNLCMRPRPRLSPQEQQLYDGLMAIFRACPRLTQPIVVWRGIRQELDMGRLGCQFISTSYEVESALRPEFTRATCCLLQITVPAGAQVLPVEHVAGQAGEWEVILPPDGTWTVLSDTVEMYGTRVMRTYAVTYVPAGGVTLDPQRPAQQTARRLAQLSEDENARRIARYFNLDTLETIYNGNYVEYFNEIADELRIADMPPLDLIMSFITSA